MRHSSEHESSRFSKKDFEEGRGFPLANIMLADWRDVLTDSGFNHAAAALHAQPSLCRVIAIRQPGIGNGTENVCSPEFVFRHPSKSFH